LGKEETMGDQEMNPIELTGGSDGWSKNVI
jgi:hypothetical protein